MTTVAELFRGRAGDTGVGLRFEGDSWTWDQVLAACEARAAMLAGLRRSGPFHVGVLLENVPEYLFLLGGAALAGAAVVGINPTRRGAELARDVRHTDCQVVVTDAAYHDLLDGLDAGVDPARILRADRPGYPPPPETAGPPGPPTGPEALYLLLFTSGSTGAPKAVRVSQGRMASQASTMAVGSGFGPDDVLYCAMPLFHGNALNTCVLPAVASGATLVLRRRFSASGFLADVRHYGVTYFNYVGRALAYVLATDPAGDDDQNTLRFGFGTDASPQDIQAFKRRFGCPIVEGYGSSEGAISMSRVAGTPRQAMGKPPPGTDVVIVDPATGDVRPDAVFDAEGRLANASDAIGEIVSRDGVGRFEGYYANADADAERTRNGWFWSGDLGYRDADGFFYFAGRTSDWLRVDGENFAAAPVERILGRFEGVRTAVVFPVPDPRTGDQVMAVLEVARPDAFDADGFARFLGEQPDLGTKWAPRFVRVVSRLPLTGTGKVDKRPLRHEGWRGPGPVYWRPFTDRTRRDDALAFRLLEPVDITVLEADFAAQDRQGLLGH